MTKTRTVVFFTAVVVTGIVIMIPTSNTMTKHVVSAIGGLSVAIASLAIFWPWMRD